MTLSLGLQLALPRPSGPYPVGRTTLRLRDASRPERLGDRPDDVREVGVVIWYPARHGDGPRASYLADGARLARALRTGGEVSPAAALAFPLVRPHARAEAEVRPEGAPFPTLLLSPGGGSNVEFYTALAEALASHGYVVVGVNHPYDVAAVALADGRVAPAAAFRDAAAVAERIAVRTRDVIFTLDFLEAFAADPTGPFAGRLDLARVGLLGHSLGGITAARGCTLDARFRACLNLDGVQAGGALSARAAPTLPRQPFMFITKEFPVAPALRAQLEALPGGSVLVEIDGARHDSFTDGPLLTPSLWPLPNDGDRVFAFVRDTTLAFFDHTLRGAPALPPTGVASGGRVHLAIFGAP